MLRLGPWLNSTFFQTQSGIRNHQIQVESDRVAKTLTGWTGAIWIIETKETRLGLGINRTVILTLKPVGEFQTHGSRGTLLDSRTTARCTGGFNVCVAVTFLKTDLQGINQPLPDVWTGYQPIHHYVDSIETLELVVVGGVKFNSFAR